jgi:hypothetical protein
VFLEKSSMTAVLVEKLTAIGGAGTLKEREWRIRCRLNWHHKARSAVRHLLYRERVPSFEEGKQIEAAHLRFCAERVRQNAAENAALFQEMRSALAAMEASDPDFFAPDIDAVRAMLLQGRDQANETRNGENP